MSATLTELLVHYGYLLVALMLFVEGLGVPIPGETALVTAAALAGRGTLSIGAVLTAACVGTIAGGGVSYWLGIRGGPAVIGRFGRVLHIDQRRLDRAQTFFDQHGAKAVFIGRFVAFLRSYVGFFAGVARMDARRFWLFNVLGGIVWSATFSAIGFAFGRNLPRLIHDLGRVSLVMAIALGLVIVLFAARGWFATSAPQFVAEIDAWWRTRVASPELRGMRTRYPKASRFVFYRFAREEYLAVHLTIGFLVSLAALGVFAAITEDVVEGAPLTRLDQAVAFRLHRAASSGLLTNVAHFTSLGAPLTIAIIAALVAVVLATQRQWITFATWTAAYGGSVLLDATLRYLVRRAELPFAAGLIESRAIALPTGHSIGALVTYGLLAHLVGSAAKRGATRAVVVAGAMTITTGVVLGRLVLGLGFISTESAAVAAGVLWLATTISGLELAKNQHPMRMTGELPVQG